MFYKIYMAFCHIVNKFLLCGEIPEFKFGIVAEKGINSFVLFFADKDEILYNRLENYGVSYSSYENAQEECSICSALLTCKNLSEIAPLVSNLDRWMAFNGVQNYDGLDAKLKEIFGM